MSDMTPGARATHTTMFALPKHERITSRKEVDLLFEPGHNSAVQAFPLRAVYQTYDAGPDQQGVMRMLVSVAKKRLRHATDRNRAKRQVREAYRLNRNHLRQHLVTLAGDQHRPALRIAFVWLATEPQTSDDVTKAMRRILSTIEHKLTTPQP